MIWVIKKHLSPRRQFHSKKSNLKCQELFSKPITTFKTKNFRGYPSPIHRSLRWWTSNYPAIDGQGYRSSFVFSVNDKPWLSKCLSAYINRLSQDTVLWSLSLSTSSFRDLPVSILSSFFTSLHTAADIHRIELTLSKYCVSPPFKPRGSPSTWRRRHLHRKLGQG